MLWNIHSWRFLTTRLQKPFLSNADRSDTALASIKMISQRLFQPYFLWFISQSYSWVFTDFLLLPFTPLHPYTFLLNSFPIVKYLTAIVTKFSWQLLLLHHQRWSTNFLPMCCCCCPPTLRQETKLTPRTQATSVRPLGNHPPYTQSRLPLT